MVQTISRASKVVIGLFLSVLMSRAGLGVQDILVLLNMPEELLQETCRYARGIIASILARYLDNLFCAMLKALGNSFVPLLQVFNVVLALAFVAALQRGVQGTAEATLLLQAASAVLCGGYIVRKASVLAPEKRHFRQPLKEYCHMAWMGTIVTISTVTLQYASTLWKC